MLIHNHTRPVKSNKWSTEYTARLTLACGLRVWVISTHRHQTHSVDIRHEAKVRGQRIYIGGAHVDNPEQALAAHNQMTANVISWLTHKEPRFLGQIKQCLTKSLSKL